jgi:hypothetical protein
VYPCCAALDDWCDARRVGNVDVGVRAQQCLDDRARLVCRREAVAARENGREQGRSMIEIGGVRVRGRAEEELDGIDICGRSSGVQGSSAEAVPRIDRSVCAEEEADGGRVGRARCPMQRGGPGVVRCRRARAVLQEDRRGVETLLRDRAHERGDAVGVGGLHVGTVLDRMQHVFRAAVRDERHQPFRQRLAEDGQTLARCWNPRFRRLGIQPSRLGRRARHAQPAFVLFGETHQRRRMGSGARLIGPD